MKAIPTILTSLALASIPASCSRSTENAHETFPRYDAPSVSASPSVHPALPADVMTGAGELPGEAPGGPALRGPDADRWTGPSPLDDEPRGSSRGVGEGAPADGPRGSGGAAGHPQ